VTESLLSVLLKVPEHFLGEFDDEIRRDPLEHWEGIKLDFSILQRYILHM